MNSIKNILLFILLGLILFSCKQQKDILQRPLRARSTSYLIEKVKENEFDCQWLSLKVGVAFKTEKLSDSFKMHVRLRKDSVIWISATYYSVEVARFYITPDTVKFMDRKANQYFIGDIEYINEKFNLDLDFVSLQALILGNSVGLDSAIKNKSYQNEGLYHISSVGKRHMRMADKGKEERINYDFAYGIAIDPKTYKVARISINDFKANKSMLAIFNKYAKVDGQLIPEKYDLQIDADQKIDATIEYIKIQANNELKFSFNIPDKYEQIN